MKKKLMILVTLFTMLVIPWNVKAANGKVVDVTTCNTVNQKDQKITTCKLTIKNDSTVEFAGGNLTIPFTPHHNTTTVKFEVNTTHAKQVEDKGTEYVIQVEPITAGSEAVLGTVTWTARANLTDADCGGKYSLNWKSASSEGTGSDDGEVTDTGYAVPTVALAIGAIGVVTVLAASKKKTKMYKI